MDEIQRYHSITEVHKALGLSTPKHPLISFHYESEIDQNLDFEGQRFAMDFYTIYFKDGPAGSMGYGRNSYDFEDGTLLFIAPSQVIIGPSQELIRNNKGWTLMFHADLLRSSRLFRTLDSYSFFSYEITEALHLSAEEQVDITTLARKIEKECNSNFDQHSQNLIVSNLELLLNYCVRFYDRQFYTRTNFNKDIVADFHGILRNYFDGKQPITSGVPHVSFFAEQMNMSTNYLSDMLKKETGLTAKAHINNTIVDRAKTALLGSTESISQIAYGLGFEYPQSFTKLFKREVGLNPKEYRNSN